MINIDSTYEQNKDTVSVSGSLTVEHATEMKVALQNAFKPGVQNIILSLGTVTKADLTFFQLLCSAHKTAMTDGKSFIVEQFHQDILIRAHDAMGFTRCHGCVLDKTKSCVLILMRA
jgi:ABC-type transporter Mla MlaB component